jgi:hypothetical protein
MNLYFIFKLKTIVTAVEKRIVSLSVSEMKVKSSMYSSQRHHTHTVGNIFQNMDQLSSGKVIMSLMVKDSSVGIVLGYGLDNWYCGVRFPEGTGNFSLHHHVQNGSGVHPAS